MRPNRRHACKCPAQSAAAESVQRRFKRLCRRLTSAALLAAGVLCRPETLFHARGNFEICRALDLQMATPFRPCTLARPRAHTVAWRAACACERRPSPVHPSSPSLPFSAHHSRPSTFVAWYRMVSSRRRKNRGGGTAVYTGRGAGASRRAHAQDFRRHGRHRDGQGIYHRRGQHGHQARQKTGRRVNEIRRSGAAGTEGRWRWVGWRRTAVASAGGAAEACASDEAEKAGGGRSRSAGG